MKKDVPLISIVIPCYNAGEYISEAVQSCLDQTYNHLEVIVVDDGSTDNSLQQLINFGTQIQVHSIVHCGAQAARNYGIRRAQGEFIQMFDADDILAPQKVELCWQAFTDDVEVVYCRKTIFGDVSNQSYRSHPIFPVIHFFTREKKSGPYKTIKGIDNNLYMTLNDSIQTSQPIYRKHLFDSIGMYDEDLKGGHELELNCRFALHGITFKAIKPRLIHYRIHDSVFRISNHRNKNLHSLQTIFKIEEQILASPYFTPKIRKNLTRKMMGICTGLYENGDIQESLELLNRIRKRTSLPLLQNHLITLRLLWGGFKFTCKAKSWTKRVLSADVIR